jgi:cyclopropane fatty-acyl-phospholipid synthase-like methyltransferase
MPNQNHYLKKGLVPYDTLLKFPITNHLRRKEAIIINKLLHQYIKPTDTVLEIGSGSGYYTKEILSITPNIVCIEESPMMIEQQKIQFNKLDLKMPKVIIGRFPDVVLTEKFDHIVTIGVLEYIENPKKFIQELLKISNKSLIFSAVEKYTFGKIGQKISKTFQIHIFPHTEKQLFQLFKPYQLNIRRVSLIKPFSAVTLIGVVNLK